MLPTPNERHEDAVEQLYHDLVMKGRQPRVHVLYGPQGHVLGEMDLMTSEYRNGQTHVTYYEVKTGSSHPERVASDQARQFYKFFLRQPGIVPRFVFYHPDRGVEYWRWRDVIYGKKH